MSFTDQSDYDVRLEWGLAGLDQLLADAQTVVIVDVLSFSTAVETAVSRGASVYPFDRRGEEAAEYARSNEALLAVARRDQGESHRFSLSPVSLTALHEGDRLVLPSPNGATLSLRAAAGRATVVAGCLRNAEAVAKVCTEGGGPIAVIAGGEKWSGYNGPLRPAIEDLIGAGAIIDHLASLKLSPEAEIACGAFRHIKNSVLSTLLNCASGRELVEAGFEADVGFAAKLNVSTAVPVLFDKRFERA